MLKPVSIRKLIGKPLETSRKRPPADAAAIRQPAPQEKRQQQKPRGSEADGHHVMRGHAVQHGVAADDEIGTEDEDAEHHPGNGQPAPPALLLLVRQGIGDALIHAPP
jgi:hypothetical protein